MASVEIRLLGRATIDAESAELWSQTVSVEEDRVTVAPVTPRGHEDDELTLRLSPASGAVKFSLAQPADQAGEEPSRFTAIGGVGAGSEVQRPYWGNLVLLLWPDAA